MELLREPNFFHLPQVSLTVPFGMSYLHGPLHPSRQPCTSCTQPHLALGPSFSVLASSDTDRDCHFVTTEEVKAGGPSIQQWSRDGG